MKYSIQKTLFMLIISLLYSTCCAGESPGPQKKKHLFILSGQSNMARLDPEVTFAPAIEQAFGIENVIIVKCAKGGQPIQRWHKDWKAPDGTVPETTGDLYDLLLNKVLEAIGEQKIKSITFLWMQGENDAKNSWGEIYATSLQGLIDQLSEDLGKKKINVVIGRLSDHGFASKRFPHWTIVREAQEEVAASNPRYVWVDTDDLNDGINNRGNEVRNDLHYTPEGYEIFGIRMAEAAIKLIN